ncbi:MAG TPA: hypothetical protein VJM12_13160 [Pyrinomonadaceae bacterium]|nr:hypothetical protein [Pyrinomonadaceae bacterium]
MKSKKVLPDRGLKINLEKIMGAIYPNRLQCLEPMIWYYQCINQSIFHLAGREGYEEDTHFARMSPEEVRSFRRYINTDLDNLSLEFYLQRAQWAMKCSKHKGRPTHDEGALTNPTLHPCRMKGGFLKIADDGNESAYTYEEFLGETLPIFVAIHNHLTSINRALGNLYYYITEVPFSSFTPTGKTEILHMTKELERLMLGLLVATHLQRKEHWQTDLVNCLVSCRSDCYRFLETIPRYYQNHRMRLVVFPIDPVPSRIDPYSAENRDRHEPLPLSCVPWAAGAYLDFLDTYQSIAHHLRAVIVWSIRLYSLWYFVPRRYLRHISPIEN